MPTVCKRVPPSAASPELARKRDRGPESQMPDGILWRVAQSPSLSLPELALLAPTCRLFKEAYAKACAAESAWLDELAAAFKSVFQADVVDGFCKWLQAPFPQTSGEPQQAISDVPTSTIWDLPDDDRISQVRKLVHIVREICSRAPAWERAEGSRNVAVVWFGMRNEGLRLLICTECAGEPVTAFGPNISLFLSWTAEEGMQFHLHCSQALALPCLGLLHHILVQEALLPSQQADGRERLRRDLLLELPEGVIREGGPHRCNEAAEEGGEVQRALSALLMRHWPRWKFRVQSRNLVDFKMVWDLLMTAAN